jgi:hypothetical protein
MSLEVLSISISLNENNTLDKSDIYKSYQVINALRHENKFVVCSDFLQRRRRRNNGGRESEKQKKKKK